MATCDKRRRDLVQTNLMSTNTQRIDRARKTIKSKHSKLYKRYQETIQHNRDVSTSSQIRKATVCNVIHKRRCSLSKRGPATGEPLAEAHAEIQLVVLYVRFVQNFPEQGSAEITKPNF